MAAKRAAPGSREKPNASLDATGATCPLAIAPLTLADLADVMALEKASFPTPWSRATYRRELTRSRRSRYLKVLRRPAAPSLIAQGGFMLLGDEMHIVTIAVLPAWRGRSIGEWLLLALLDLGRSQGGRTAALEARVSNAAALRLYGKLGFVEVGYRRRYYPDKEDARVLALADLHTRRVWQPLQERYARLTTLMQRGVQAPR